MNWLGPSLCFLFWIGAGFWLQPRVPQLRSFLRGLNRSQIAFVGSGGFLLGMVVLIGGLYLLAMAGGSRSGSIQIWAWPFVLLIGLGFVLLQATGAAALLTLLEGRPGETRSPTQASNSGDTEQP